MSFLPCLLKRSKNTQIMNNEIDPFRRINEIYEQTGKQIQEGLNKETASTGTPMKELRGGAKYMAQMSNIGGGSKATGGGGFKEGFNIIGRHQKAEGIKKALNQKSKKKLIGKKRK